jgi:hypothetical protein
VTRRLPVGHEVHTPPCLTQNEHPQARAGISLGSGCQSRVKLKFRQWQLPVMSMLNFRQGFSSAHGTDAARVKTYRPPRRASKATIDPALLRTLGFFERSTFTL